MIFLLLIVGSILIILNVHTLKKEKGSFKFTLDNAENHMEEFEVKLGELRREFSETILELQIEIQRLNEKLNSNVTKLEVNEKKEKIKEISSKKSENNTANGVKINEIEKLILAGLTIEEIAEKLGMGKGEVLLIKQLYIK